MEKIENSVRELRDKCNECLELLEEYNRPKRPQLSTGESAGHTSTELSWREIDTAFKGRMLTGAVINSNYIEPLDFLQAAKEIVLEKVRDALEKHESVKVNAVFNGEVKAGEQCSRESEHTKNCEIFRTTDLEELYKLSILEPLLTSLKESQERDSGWALSRILNLTVDINKYNSLHAGGKIRVPEEIALKKATINVPPEDNEKKFKCDRCLHYFYSNDRLQDHESDCAKLNSCAVKLPSEDDKWLFFDNYTRKEPLPFVVYADLECILEKTEDWEVNEKLPPHAYQRHRVFTIAYYVHCSYDASLSRYHCRRDAKCVSWFVEELKKLANEVKSAQSSNIPMKELTTEQSEAFNNAAHCHICEKPFDKNDRRVRDHCHLTGRYRGPAHRNCNSNYKNSFCIPIVFHNLSEYDSHFIIEKVANAFEGSVRVLPKTKEKYTSFTKEVKDEQSDSRNCIKLRFIDSYKFLNTSLDKLASIPDANQLTILRSEFQNLSNENLEMLTRRVVFPYEYLDSEDKLDDQRLPPLESFDSSLTGESVSESDYAHAEKVWKSFNIKTLGEYSDLYLKTGVLLLADVFENFRKTCIENYGLDPAYYYTLPGFTWDAMLKHTRIRLELLTDIDMVIFIERGKRGGLSQCSGRHAEANNKYMQSYDPSKPTSYLMYFDINNLYGWAMCQPLPYGEFKWVQDIERFDISLIAADSPIGYILEVDLEYPQSLHDVHADLPFCPAHDKPTGKSVAMLLATLRDKQRYVIHYSNLQQCTRHGLRIRKIHRILQFAQSTWLRGYMELNTQFRTNAANDLEKNLYKFMNNAVFGKSMENVRKYVDMKLVTHWDGPYGAEVMIAEPNFHSSSIFSEDLAVVELRKVEVSFNKPIFVGMCILDIAKTKLYEFHYDYMVPRYGKNCKVMYTDTDSLIYHIMCTDIYETMRSDISRFDTSDYPVENQYNIPLVHKKVPGLMKDENNGMIMTRFVGLRSKMYSFCVDGKSDTKKAEGVKASVLKTTITFDDYMRCLQEETVINRKQTRIRSEKHEVYSVSEEKVALNPYDDKRYVKPNSTETLPWGHYQIPSCSKSKP